MNFSKLSAQDWLTTEESNQSEYVVISSDGTGNGFSIAESGGFLERVGGKFYKCKRIVAENLSLKIISEFPMKMF